MQGGKIIVDFRYDPSQPPSFSECNDQKEINDNIVTVNHTNTRLHRCLNSLLRLLIKS